MAGGTRTRRRQPIVTVGVFPPRCHLLGHRIHHGLFGVLLIVHDWRDRRRWLRDFLHVRGDR